MKPALSLLGALMILGSPMTFPPTEVVEKVTLAALFAGLLWFVLGQFRELTAQVRAQNDALLAVVKDNTAAMSVLCKRLEDVEAALDVRNRSDG